MIIAHIIGINSYLKQDFVTKINNINVDVIDLDEITKRLLIKSDYNLRPEDWKEQIYNELNRVNGVNGEINRVNKETHKIIIGLTNFINDNRYKIKLDTDNYFFIDTHLYQIIAHFFTYPYSTTRLTAT